MNATLRGIALGVTLHSAIAVAGSDHRDCETTDKTIVMTAGTTNRITIKVVDEHHRSAVHEAPVMIMPHHGYNVDATADEVIIAVPIASEKVVSKHHQVLHVTHKDGTSCDGRESWDDRSVQSYVLMARGGGNLAALAEGTPVKGLTPEGYVVARLSCHSYGVSSPGGCFAGPDDATEWK